MRIHRVHLEEDAAKLIHVGESGRIHGSERSVVDFNRGGTPLVEIVTEPDLRSAGAGARVARAAARDAARARRQRREHGGGLAARRRERLAAAGRARDALGTKTELKNMNSFRFLERGIAAEIERQRAIIEAGGAVEQETLHFDPASGAITSLRSKEEAHDYRYFPEPDLVPIATTAAMIDGGPRGASASCRRRAPRASSASSGCAPERARLLAFRGELGDFFERGAGRRRRRTPRRRSRTGSAASSWRGSATATRARRALDAGGARRARRDGRRRAR